MDAEEPALFARPYGVHEGIRRKRVKQLIGALLLGLLLALALAIFRQDVQTSTSLALATLCIASSALLNGVGRPLLAGSVALWTLTVLALYEMWFKQGLYSPACLILPVVLVMANMMVGLRQSLVLLGFIVAGLAVIGTAGAMEWRTFPITPTSFAHLGYIIIIICAFSFMAFVLASDLRKAMAHLREEVTHVTDGQARLQYLAHHDELTALPNRRLGKVLVNKAIAAAQRRASPLALVFIDLDNFKKINDSLGHSAGDELLKEVATRLAHSVRHSDAVFRLGGDEFLVLLPELPSPEDASPLIGRMLGEISRPIKLLGLDVAITGSAGVAMYPEDGTDFDTLSKHADFAAQHAKESGRNAFRYFSNDMNVNMLEDLNLHSAMRSGLERGEFFLHFQPIVNLQTQAILGAECLLRWRHPSMGMISPARFIPLAERSGLIIELGEWVLEQAVAQLHAWRGTALAHIELSVNVSTVQFKRATLDAVVSRVLARHDISPQLLKLEVTESALIHDAEKFVAMCRALRSLGVRLAIDDFGTGYSNLAYLQRFEVDDVKIDQLFIRRLTQFSQDKAIVQAIIQMAHALNVQTTAEGIEDLLTHDSLTAMGCDKGQGYWFARPQELKAFEALVATA